MTHFRQKNLHRLGRFVCPRHPPTTNFRKSCVAGATPALERFNLMRIQLNQHINHQQSTH
jgi:hypothetical protein